MFLAALAGATCLMRAAVGEIAAAPGGKDFVLRLLDECRAIAEAVGFPPRPATLDRVREQLTAAGSPFKASMLRDMESGGPIEAEHIIGDLLQRGNDDTVLLPAVYAALKIYESRR